MIKYFFYATFLFIFISYINTPLHATDKESKNTFREAQKKYNKGNYKAAAKEFLGAELYADNYVLKARSLEKAAEAYRKADLKYEEFKCLSKLIECYPNQINFQDTVRREYEIGNAYYNGYREHPFSWFPWIENDNRTSEIYEKIYRQSPYAGFVPTMMIKLGRFYLKNDKTQKAITTYRKIIDLYPNSKVTYIAYIELANIYLQLSKIGDGDGSNAKTARSLLTKFMEEYPDSPEMTWAKNALEQTYENQADDLLKLAEYYDDYGNTNASKRYIREILVNYPETKSVRNAEVLLNSIEMPLYPRKIPPVKKTYTKYDEFEFKDTPTDVLVIPANSSHKWLTPIDNLGLRQNKLMEKEYINKI